MDANVILYIISVSGSWGIIPWQLYTVETLAANNYGNCYVEQTEPYLLVL